MAFLISNFFFSFLTIITLILILCCAFKIKHIVLDSVTLLLLKEWDYHLHGAGFKERINYDLINRFSF